MPMDFSTLSTGAAGAPLIDPRQIFAALPFDRSRYPYMRDVQGEVLEQWFRRRDESDLVVKMNTGGGKTVVGLLALQSSINDGAGPALYLVPDNYLLAQVTAEAKALGISTTDDPRSAEYQAGRAICVTNVFRLFNGRSVFGLTQANRLPIGTVLIDDAHACLSSVRDQFTVSIRHKHTTYDALFKLLYPSLVEQSRGSAEEINAGDPNAYMAVPPWAWAELQDRVVPLLVAAAQDEDEEIGFTWPLIRDVVGLCNVAVTSRQIQIAPDCLPVSRVPSFVRAKRRLFLSATLADDSVLVSDFGADAASVSRPIVPTSASDLGDRLILSPLETHPTMNHETLREFLHELSKEHNTVVIAPSDKRADVWSDVADRVCTSKTIHETVDELRRGHVGLVVFSNRYDGIDLPGDACRILVIDGLPTYATPLELLEAEMVDGTDQVVGQQLQRIEQGMGRGVRSNDDHCVVVLSDIRLAAQVWTHGATHFSPATAAQLDLSRQVAAGVKGADLDDYRATIRQVLDRDANWVAASRAALAPILSSTESSISAAARVRREAFDLAESGRIHEAVGVLTALSNQIDDQPTRGWIKQRAASYLYQTDRVGADKLQSAARGDNRSAFRPVGHLLSPTLLRKNLSQGQASAARLKEQYGTPQEAVFGVEVLIDRLRPRPGHSHTRDFERAFEELGFLLGFSASQPEREHGAGPDALWGLGVLDHLVIELKSGSEATLIDKRDLAQLGHAVDWFRSRFDDSCTATPIIVHPSRQCGPGAVAAEGTRAMTFDQLESLKVAVRQFIQALSNDVAFDAALVNERLAACELNGNGFATRWTRSIRPA